MDTNSGSKTSLAFRRFVLLPHRRELLADGKPVRLGARAFDLLLALVEARAALVSKDALMARVWHLLLGCFEPATTAASMAIGKPEAIDDAPPGPERSGG
jgi:DNA-binding response OmpR family regulator